MRDWLFLGLAIASEVSGTAALKASEGFSRLWPSLGVVIGYGLAFYCLSRALRSIPLGVAYAIWSGLGIVAVCLIGTLVFKQKLDAPAALGMALIISGVIIMQVWSQATH
jgi:small multidrug resistance pump